MEILEKVIDKVRKLFALGTSPNEHEAAAAVAKARSLLAEYDLTMETIGDLKADSRTSIRKGASIVQATEGKPEGWKFDLFTAVAESHDCHTAASYVDDYTPSGKRRSIKVGNLIGFGHDVEAAGYALSFLVGEIERLAQTYADGLWAEIRAYRDTNGLTQHVAESQYTSRTGRHPLSAKWYFIKGAAERVIDDMRADYWNRKMAAREAQTAAESRGEHNPMAIMLVKGDAIEDFLSMERYGKTKAQRDADSAAYLAKWKIDHEERLKAQAQALAKRTPAQVRADEEEARRAQDRANRAWERQCEAEARRRDREEAKVDQRAFRAGSAAGSEIRIRPGVKAGKEQRGIR